MIEPADVRELRSTLSSLGFVVDGHRDGGAFEETVFTRPGVVIGLNREYSNWLVTMTIDGVGAGPAWFWLRALDGSSDLPPQAESDDSEFGAHVEAILDHQESLGERVRQMGAGYRAAVKRRLELDEP